MTVERAWRWPSVCAFWTSRVKELLLGGAALARLDRIDASQLDARIPGLRVEVACDVNNPLTGPTGASHIYGPQKGADARMAHELDAALERYAAVLERDLGKAVRDVPGAGAAGGLGAGLIAFLGAELKSGVDIVFSAIRLDQYLKDSDLVITGEGRIDATGLIRQGTDGCGAACARDRYPNDCNRR